MSKPTESSGSGNEMEQALLRAAFASFGDGGTWEQFKEEATQSKMRAQHQFDRRRLAMKEMAQNGRNYTREEEDAVYAKYGLKVFTGSVDEMFKGMSDHLEKRDAERDAQAGNSAKKSDKK